MPYFIPTRVRRFESNFIHYIFFDITRSIKTRTTYYHSHLDELVLNERYINGLYHCWGSAANVFRKQEVIQYVDGYVPKRILGVLFESRELNMGYDTYQNGMLVINLVVDLCRSIETETNI